MAATARPLFPSFPSFLSSRLHKQSFFMLPRPPPLRSFSPLFWCAYPVTSWSARIRIWSKWPKLGWESKPLSDSTSVKIWGITMRNCVENTKIWGSIRWVSCVLFQKGNRQEERTVELPTATFPDDIAVARAVISGPIYICFELSRKTLQYKLSACETITQGPHRTSFSWAYGQSVCVCVLHNSLVSGPCSLGQDLDREYYCGHRWWTIPHLTVFVIYKPARSNAQTDAVCRRCDRRSSLGPNLTPSCPQSSRTAETQWSPRNATRTSQKYLLWAWQQVSWL